MNYHEIAKAMSAEYSKGFDSGRSHTLKFVLEYLEEVPSAQGLESLIKKIQQREEVQA
jgi:hypothetical protein